ncbi:MAG: M23 family metallopeptidase [Pseudomonadota bacterium]
MSFRFLPILLFLSACSFTQPPASVSFYGAGDGPGSKGAHIVLKGDTLYSLSKRYNVPLQDIAIVNSISAPFTLDVGERVDIPAPPKYKVRPGDTLYSISRLFETSTSDIASQNNLRAPYRISEGQSLRISNLYAEPARTYTSAADETKSSGYSAKPRSKPVRAVSRVSTRPVKSKITAKTPKRSSNKFMTPVRGRVVSSYGPKKGGLHNDGINIAAPKGAPVRAAENGVVVYAGDELKGSGNLVLVRHEGRWMTAYAHMDKVLIKRGQVIKRGETLGTVGQTGSVDSPQLHFEVRRGTQAINPKLYIEG